MVERRTDRGHDAVGLGEGHETGTDWGIWQEDALALFDAGRVTRIIPHNGQN